MTNEKIHLPYETQAVTVIKCTEKVMIDGNVLLSRQSRHHFFRVVILPAAM